MSDVLPILLVTILGAVLAAASSVGLSQRERKWVTVSFFMHVGFACIQVPLMRTLFSGVGDMFGYFAYGEILARMMERDPLRVIPQVTALLLHDRPNLPLAVVGAGSGTGSMSALTAWTFYLLGSSKYAASVAFALFSMCGAVAMYRVFRANVPPASRTYAAIAVLLLPSFVFWSSGTIKEAVVVGGLGWSFFGLHLWIREGRLVSGSALMIAGAIPILLVKPYILFPTVLAAGSWYYWDRSLKEGRVRVRPGYLVIAGALSLGGIVVLGRHFPEYGFDDFGAQASWLRQVTQRGGSAFSLGEEAPTTLAGQFAYVPAALLASLFRPFIFEAHNVPSLVNALETTALALLFARVLFMRNLRNVRRQITDNPFLVFCLVFSVAFGVAVGLSTSNLGTLSRYRSPLMPFFVLMLLVLGERSHAGLGTQAHRSEPAFLGLL